VRSSRIEGDIVPVVGHADDPVECVAAELDEGFGEWKGRAIEAGLAGGPVEAVVEIGSEVELVEGAETGRADGGMRVAVSEMGSQRGRAFFERTGVE
jgi:hypothetical protein